MDKKKFEDVIKGLPGTENLRNVSKCGRVDVVCGDLSMHEYTYLAEDGLHIAESTAEGWNMRGGEDLRKSVIGLGALLGVSPLKRTSFLYELPNDEALCLAALMDLQGLASLQEDAGAEISAEFTPEAVRGVIEAPEGGVEHTIAGLIRVQRPGIKADPEKALASLAAKKFCVSDGGSYFLNDELMTVATALARPTATVLISVTEKKGDGAAASSSFALQGSIVDNLSVAYREESVVFCSMSSVELLTFIKSTVALAGPAPAEAPREKPAETEPRAAASSGTWTCACGRENSGAFCPICGAPRPKEPAAPAPASGEWTCACGRKNTGAFCPQCGAKRP